MEQIRLQKYFTDCGVMSRRAAETMIAAGRVTVNGEVATIGLKIDPLKDIVEYAGKRVLPKTAARHTYIMLNKPMGFITTLSDELGRRTITDLIRDVGTRVYPVGRLDMYSEGLLLLTDDGELANGLTHPKTSLPKVYQVLLNGEDNDDKLEILTKPMIIDGYELRPVQCRKINSAGGSTLIELTLHEGRNRQIRKMCDEAGLAITRLARVKIGELTPAGLARGKWRHLTDDEVAYLKKTVGTELHNGNTDGVYDFSNDGGDK